MPFAICPICNEKFRQRHGKQKYCSHACLLKHRREYQRDWRREERAILRGERFCAWCGERIIKAGRHKYCSDKCSAAANRAAVKARYHKLKEELNDGEKPKDSIVESGILE